ncbi:MAG: hypothetical protein GY679_00520 [Mycoplasma sp.]|nr:hypothetical protein [Mycoplasma sp.]
MLNQKNKKPRSGWQKRKKKKKWKLFNNLHFIKKTNRLISRILIRPKKMAIGERIVKTFIWIALRIAIKPSLWKDNRKNYQIIDRAYKRIMAPDFIFIPPSFAFYLIMAFLPITLLVLLLTANINWVSIQAQDMLTKFLGIEGSKAFIDTIKTMKSVGAISTIVPLIAMSFWISSSGFAKFVYTESYIYDHEKFGSYWANKFRGMFIVLCITIYMTIAVICLSALPGIISWMGLKERTTGWNFVYIIMVAIGSLIGIYIGTLSLFRFSPRFKLHVRQIHPGAIATTIPLTLFVVLFTQLTKVLFQYKGYGQLSVFMIISASMFQISYYIYIGLIVNVVFYKTHFGEDTVHKKTFSKK